MTSRILAGSSRSHKKIAHFHGSGALRLNAEDPYLCGAMSVDQAHQRLVIAKGVIQELQEQWQRVTAEHQAAHEALQTINQEMNLLRNGGPEELDARPVWEKERPGHIWQETSLEWCIQR